jgi:hypothetical protein
MTSLLIGPTYQLIKDVIYALPGIPLTFVSGLQVSSVVALTSTWMIITPTSGQINGCFVKSTLGNTTITLSAI